MLAFPRRSQEMRLRKLGECALRPFLQAHPVLLLRQDALARGPSGVTQSSILFIDRSE
jgi:hypothetical protein